MSANTPSQPSAPSTETGAQEPRSRRRFLPWLAVGLVPVVLGSGAVAAQAHKSVELEVDGRTETVTTFAGTVGGLLDEEGLEVGKHDVLAPGTESALADGDEIVVQTARPMVVELNGEVRDIWTTARTADELVANHLESGRNVTIAASRSLDGGRVELDLPLVQDGEAIVVADGERTRVELEGEAYVPDALAAADVEVSDADYIKVGAADDGTVQVTVVRVVEGERSESEPIDFETVRREDSSLYEGQTKVVQEGAPGKRTVSFEIVTVDGEEVWSRRSGTEVSEPTERIVAVGTAERPAPRPVATSSNSSRSTSSGSSSSSSGSSSSAGSSSSGSSSSGSRSSGSNSDAGASGSSSPSGGVWARLAQCESGGDPTIVSSNGLYYGLYQFSVGTWRSVGGSGLPSQASPAEQTQRAKALQARSGWGQWPHCSSVLGLR